MPGDALLPEQQHKATDKRSEIVLAINFSRRTKRNCSKHLFSYRSVGDESQGIA